MIKRFLGWLFKWDSSSFVGSRRFWLMVSFVFLVSAWLAVYSSLDLLQGWQHGEIKLWCRGCGGRPPVDEQDYPVVYWFNMIKRAIAALAGSVLCAVCGWVYVNRSKL